MSAAAAKVHVFTLNNGQPFPSVGFGTWAFEETGGRDVIDQVVYDAIEQGIRHIDTAWFYKVEDKVGAGIKRAIADGLVKREELVVVTKVWVINLRKERVLAQAKESLASLGLDQIDVLLVHWPMPMTDNGKGEHFPMNEDGSFRLDNDVDIYEETWKAMEQLVDEGLTKSIGVSNFTSAQIDKLVASARIKPVVNQVESNPVLPNNKVLAACKKHGIIMTAYQPFGGQPQPQKDGSLVLTDSRKALFESPVVKSIADKYGKTVAQILLKFHVARGASVIFKSVTKSRIAENLNIFDFELTEEDLAALNGLKTGQRTCFMPQVVGTKYDPFADDD